MPSSIANEHFVLRRFLDNDLSGDGMLSSSAIDDKDSALSVDWCKFNGCKQAKCVPPTFCYTKPEIWQPTQNRAPVLIYFSTIQRQYPSLTLQTVTKFFPLYQGRTSVLRIPCNSGKKIKADKTLSNSQKDFLLSIADQKPSKLPWRTSAASVEQIRKIIQLRVYHAPSNNNPAHSIIDQSAFEKDSPEREDMLDELRQYFLLVS